MTKLGVHPRFGYCSSPFLASSPLIVGDLLFLVTGNGVDNEGRVPSPHAPSFVALDKKTGTVVWQDRSPGDRVLDGQWSSPAYAEVNGQAQVLFGGGDGWLYAFEPLTGKLLWKFDCDPLTPHRGPHADTNRTRCFPIAVPVVYDNKVYVGVGRGEPDGPGPGHLWCIDLARAAERGRRHPGADVSPVGGSLDSHTPANREKSAPLWHRGGLVPRGQVEKTGREYFFGRTSSSCVIADGLVYAVDLDGFLYCLDAQTGRQYWVHDLETLIVQGSPLWVSGKIYMPAKDGDIWIFAHGKEKREPRKIAMDVPVHRPLVCVDGVLYLLAESALFAVGQTHPGPPAELP